MEWVFGFCTGIIVATIILWIARGVEIRRQHTKAGTPSASYNTGMDAIALGDVKFSLRRVIGLSEKEIEMFIETLKL